LWVVAYQQEESRLVVSPALGGNTNPAIRTYPEGIMPNSISVGTPFAPGSAPPVAAVIQQGILDPATATNANIPAFHPIWIDAPGDDMLILCEKEQPPNPTPGDPWAFAGEDTQFGNFFTSSENSGIFVMTGMMP
jgi:hypothetical protein